MKIDRQFVLLAALALAPVGAVAQPTTFSILPPAFRTPDVCHFSVAQELPAGFSATTVNAARTTLGRSYTAGTPLPTVRAARLTTAGLSAIEPLPGDVYSGPLALNSTSTALVSSSNAEAGERLFVHEANGAVLPIPPFWPSGSLIGSALGNNGTVVGVAQLDQGMRESFIAFRGLDGTYKYETLNRTLEGSDRTDVAGVNNKNQVIATRVTQAGSQVTASEYAFANDQAIATKHATGPLGTVGNFINDSGTIAGALYTASPDVRADARVYRAKYASGRIKNFSAVGDSLLRQAEAAFPWANFRLTPVSMNSSSEVLVQLHIDEARGYYNGVAYYIIKSNNLVYSVSIPAASFRTSVAGLKYFINSVDLGQGKWSIARGQKITPSGLENVNLLLKRGSCVIAQ